MVIEISSADGAARHFIFAGRRATSRPGRVGSPSVDSPSVDSPDLSIRFPSAGVGVAALLAPDGPDRLFQGMLDGSIEMEGDRRLLLWFQGLVPAAIPGFPAFHLPHTPPSPYVQPTANPEVNRRIVREPAVAELDRAQPDAWAAREKILMMRVAAGERPKPF
ncbi:MAG: hypothetical protein VYE73_00960 [Acidobacteriota bacterium]|nr:hypothetical protein [Acidobacteriota bacterium]